MIIAVSLMLMLSAMALSVRRPLLLQDVDRLIQPSELEQCDPPGQVVPLLHRDVRDLLVVLHGMVPLPQAIGRDTRNCI